MLEEHLGVYQDFSFSIQIASMYNWKPEGCVKTFTFADYIKPNFH